MPLEKSTLNGDDIYLQYQHLSIYLSVYLSILSDLSDMSNVCGYTNRYHVQCIVIVTVPLTCRYDTRHPTIPAVYIAPTGNIYSAH